MEGKQFFQRILSVAIGMGVIFCVFFGVLFNLQIVHGAEYAERAQRKIANTETVPASRGFLLDRYGRPLVTNRVTYQVTLDVPLMGDAKSETILSLIAICKERGIVWTDTMPVTQTAPYMLTAAAQGENTEKQLARLGEKSNWDVSTADGLMGALRSYYKVPKTLSPEEDRALLGVLYEVALRKKEVTWSEYSFATDVDIDFISMVKEQQLVGVQVEPVTVRQYNTTAAPHLLGRTGPMNPTEWETYQELGYAMNETVGKDGAEQAFESWLRGTAGLRAVETNASGKIVSQQWIDAPQPGGNVITTIDLSLQQTLEASMKKHIPQLTDTVKGGAGVVIDVNSGAVRAMASYPDFDLTTIYKDTAAYEKAAADPLTPFVNRATQGLYSPGSTFKMVTAIGGLQEGIITPDTKLLDTGRYMYYAPSYTPSCWVYKYGRTHGWLNVSKAIEVSCNVFFYDVGRRLGIEKLGEYARLFGLGEKTGFELYEKAGTVAGPEYTESIGQVWNEGSVLPAAIGQENNQFTPLQLANYVATLVNGGHHYSTHLLQSVKSHDFSQVLYTREPEELDTINIEQKNLDAVKAGMLSLTEVGSVSGYFKNLGVKVGAKTGSAQVGNNKDSNAVFVCYAPFENPQIAIALVAEQGGSGGDLGAIAAEVMSFYFSNETAMGTVVGENQLIR